MPQVVKNIRKILRITKKSLTRFGQTRPTVGHIHSRLRAVVHKINGKFATDIRTYGKKRILKPAKLKITWTLDKTLIKENNEKEFFVTQKEMKNWVKKIYPYIVIKSGIINMVQFPIATTHVENIIATVTRWLQYAIRMVLPEDKFRANSDYYGKFHISNIPMDIKKFFKIIKRKINVDINDQIYTETLVAIKIFVNNICRQVIERYIIAFFPEIFNPLIVSQFTDDEFFQIGAESEKQNRKREKFSTRAKKLRNSFDNFQRR
ncbi:hypothetical protein PoMZ_08999 [Pyricularia oryzae]|uniref:GED domain-containing protein n=1 Tax=Pyricularia oryzae TaxID=318829 RepID=A0A4P7MSW0_PYROR|nr:hypothetical protein PoMZ_08999 [Pyricularia oryzae]